MFYRTNVRQEITKTVLAGVENCQCTHHQNTPIYVDDTPVSNGTV
jgi:hypothetical protein